jgi:hypothetical protein
VYHVICVIRSHPGRRKDQRCRSTKKGEKVMGKEARIGLLLGASACLMAVMVDWVVWELHDHQHQH